MRTSRIAKLVGVAVAIPAMLLASPGSASASTSATNIGYGYNMSSSAVWCVQESLNYFQQHSYGKDAYVIPTLAQDGVFGPSTEQAIEYFQRDMNSGYNGGLGLTVDGVVGKQTGNALVAYGDPYYTGGGMDTGAYCFQYIPTLYN